MYVPSALDPLSGLRVRDVGTGGNPNIPRRRKKQECFLALKRGLRLEKFLTIMNFKETLFSAHTLTLDYTVRNFVAQRPSFPGS